MVMPLSAYPRVCGATKCRLLRRISQWGLSPRVRGNLSRSLSRPECEGPIPACAGQPDIAGLFLERFPAYPRVCGATRKILFIINSFVGLSPRVRGNRLRMEPIGRNPGPIPACAGQPKNLAAWASRKRAYPRVCGATTSISTCSSFRPGLSPRVRGNRSRARKTGNQIRPIPACAGQPAALLFAPSAVRAYPRVCGATQNRIGGKSHGWGLSPRVRGNRGTCRSPARGAGPIPACAGQPRLSGVCRLSERAYPRVCGATELTAPLTKCDVGLSPRVRGNRDAQLKAGLAVGPIPACAGQPNNAYRVDGVARAYPRVCGATTAPAP